MIFCLHLMYEARYDERDLKAYVRCQVKACFGRILHLELKRLLNGPSKNCL